MSFDPAAGLTAAITERLAEHMQQPRTITAAECYDLAGKSWMPAAASDALIRAARTIEALEAA